MDAEDSILKAFYESLKHGLDFSTPLILKIFARPQVEISNNYDFSSVFFIVH
jgi:hypothetical protein